MKQLISLLFILLLSQGVSAQLTFAGKPFPVQCNLFDSMRNVVIKGGIDSLVKKTEPYIEQAITEDDEILELYLKLRLLDDINKAGNDNDKEFLRRLNLLKIKCEQKKHRHLTAICFDIYSRYYKRKGNRNDALKYALMSYELYSAIDNSQFVYKQNYLMHLAHLYYDFRDFESALKYLHLARSTSEKENLGLLNTIALANGALDRYDSSLYYFDVLIKASEEAGDEGWRNMAINNSVDLYIVREMYDTALSICMRFHDLQEEISAEAKADTNNIGQYRGRANHCTTVGYIYYKLGKLQLADKYYARALNLYRKAGDEWYYEELHIAIVAYREYARVKYSMKDYKMAYHYTDTLKMLTDTLNSRVNIAQMKRIETELEKTKSENANRELIYEQAQTKLQRNLLIVGIIAATFIILFIVNRYKISRQKLEDEKNSAKYELKASQDKLAIFTNNIQEKNKLLEKLEQKLTTYESHEQAAEYTATISELQEATILTDDDWADFKKAFEKANPGYLSLLKEKYPDLTQAEIRYVVLSKLDMNTKEIASVLGITAGSVRTTKSRLMRKTGFENEEDLNNMINLQ